MRASLSAKEDDHEEKLDPTIRYLQKLGSDNLETTFQWARWTFDVDADRALKVCLFKAPDSIVLT